MGEDVHRLNGGTNGATRGLKDAYPDRVLGTPISENGFTGLAGGIALDGRYRPVVELMYADFMWVAADQLFNQIGKARHMFGGTSPVPYVLRSKVAIGTGYGSQHSMDPAGIFATQPGWRIVAPSTPYDYVGAHEQRAALSGPGGRAGARGAIPERSRRQQNRAPGRAATAASTTRACLRRSRSGRFGTGFRADRRERDDGGSGRRPALRQPVHLQVLPSVEALTRQPNWKVHTGGAPARPPPAVEDVN